MIRYLLRRLGVSLLLLAFVLTLVFFLQRLVPGNPAEQTQGPRVSSQQRENLRRLYGLDRPLPVQYLAWMGAVLRGDLGTSLSQQRPVINALREAIPPTFLLATAALAIEFGLGFFLGIGAARRPGSAFDHALRVGGLVLFSQPVFWLGLMAILLFSYAIPLFPASHMRSVDSEDLGPLRSALDVAHHLLLPALVMGVARAGGTARIIRSRLLEVLQQDYIRTARACGLPERRVLWVHALRNLLGPMLQIFSLSVPPLLSGSLVTEIVFGWPGLGRLTFNALLSRDYPLILAATGLTAGLVVFCNFLADLGLAAIDPRVRDA